MIQFLYGMNTMGFLTAGLFFWRFWQKTSDSLFIAFGLAFALFALDQFFRAVGGASASAIDWAFVFRLVGFALLLFAVMRKNLK